MELKEASWRENTAILAFLDPCVQDETVQYPVLSSRDGGVPSGLSDFSRRE